MFQLLVDLWTEHFIQFPAIRSKSVTCSDAPIRAHDYFKETADSNTIYFPSTRPKVPVFSLGPDIAKIFVSMGRGGGVIVIYLLQLNHYLLMGNLRYT